jgi:hypothetical protein
MNNNMLDNFRKAHMEVGSLESVKKSYMWYKIYREYLYMATPHHDAIRKRLDKYMSIAKKEADIVMNKYNIETLYCRNMENGMGIVDHVPFWRNDPFGTNMKAKRSLIRHEYWYKKGNEKFAELHYLRYIALTCVSRTSWPVTKYALHRAKKMKERLDGTA